MARAISTRDFDRMKKKAEGAQKSARRARDRAGQTMEHITRTFAVSGTAYGLSLYMGRVGPDSAAARPLNIPLGLGLGLTAHLLAMTGLAGNLDNFARNFGDGALAQYTAQLGMESGIRWRETGTLSLAGAEPYSVTSGHHRPGASGAGQRLSDAELAALQNV